MEMAVVAAAPKRRIHMQSTVKTFTNVRMDAARDAMWSVALLMKKTSIMETEGCYLFAE